MIEEQSDDENDDDGPQGGRMMPVIELIKGFIPRIVSTLWSILKIQK